MSSDAAIDFTLPGKLKLLRHSVSEVRVGNKLLVLHIQGEHTIHNAEMQAKHTIQNTEMQAKHTIQNAEMQAKREEEDPCLDQIQ